MNLKERAKNLKIDIPTIFLVMKDQETPITAKIFAAVTVCYALSPIDFIPDFIPILGYLDDFIILPALIVLTIKFIPKDMYLKHRKEAEQLWQDGKPKKWFYSIPILLFWVFIAYLVIKAYLA